MDINKLKNLLKRYNLRPNFTYGQNFLLDDDVLDDILAAADITPADQVLEIGPGIGNLTRVLCERAGFILSVEKDPKFQPLLHAIKKDHRDNFRFEIADALEYDFQKTLKERRTPAAAESNAESKHQRPISVRLRRISDQSAGYKVVANIPYFITGKILQMLMTAESKPSTIVILTQKEVAERIIAKAGDLSVLAISVQIFGEPKIMRIVPKESFYPAPKVDSAVLKIDLPNKPKYPIGDEKFFFKVVKACFAGKRKQIHNTLVNNLGLDKREVAEKLSALGIDPKARPQELGIEKWIQLANKM